MYHNHNVSIYFSDFFGEDVILAGLSSHKLQQIRGCLVSQYGRGSQCKAWIHTLDPHAINSPDPYPRSIPKNDMLYFYQATLVDLLRSRSSILNITHSFHTTGSLWNDSRTRCLSTEDDQGQCEGSWSDSRQGTDGCLKDGDECEHGRRYQGAQGQTQGT